MKDGKRGIRRADRTRLAKKRKAIYQSDKEELIKQGRNYHVQKKRFGDVPVKPERVDTPTPCSCGCCGNPRRHQKNKLTIQEEKAKINAQQQLKEDRT